MQAHSRFLDEKIVCVVGDSTMFQGNGAGVTAIANSANSSLLCDGGVDSAIHRAADPALLEECRALRQSTFPDELPTGAAMITHAAHWPVTHVIHAVGPVWVDGDAGEPELLRSAYTESFRVTKATNVAEIAISALLTDVFGYPPQLAATQTAGAISAHRQRQDPYPR